MKFASFEEVLKNRRKVLIYGYGVEGRQSEDFLRARFPGIKLEIFDQGIKEFSKEIDLNDFQIIVLTAGIAREKLPEGVQGKITSAANIFFDNLGEAERQKIIGITGTKGKSTVTKLTFEALKNAGKRVKIGGNYGVPMLSIFRELSKLDFIILELSSYQLEYLKVSPHLCIFTNFYIDHTDRHHTLENYFNAKSQIFRHQKTGDITFISKNYQTFLEPAVSTFKNWGKGGTFKSKLVLCDSLSVDFFSQNSTFKSPHLLQNFGMVYVLCKHLGVSEDSFKKTCQEFEGLEHRLEFVGTFAGIDFINDANATTPDASVAAMTFFKEKLGSVIVGGQDRGYNFNRLISIILKYKPFIIILESESGKRIREMLEKANYTKFKVVKNMEEIVKTAFENTHPGKTALLSMGSPSYGYFKNFEEKGKCFKEMVKNYK